MQPNDANMQGWNWDDLRVFLAAHRGRSLAAAGRALGIDATTVGRRLAALEAAARTTLFQRTLAGLVPTAAADAIVEATRMMERQALLVARQITGDDTKVQGLVRLAVTDQFASHFLVDHLARLHVMHPGIELELVTSDRLADLARGDADLALRFSPPGKAIPLASGASEVLAQKVGSVAVAVFASARYLAANGAPSGAYDLDGRDVVIPRASASFFPGAQWFRAAEARGKVVLRTDGLTGMAAATAAGLGLSALPVFMTLRYPHLTRIGKRTAVDERDVWLLVAADLRRVARVAAVREFLVQVLKDEAGILAGRSPRRARGR